VIRRANRSWWMEEALADRVLDGEPTRPLHGDTRADVVVMGGGYTGMWTAWFLKEREPDLDVVLVERDVCGGGPSGRNGGFCNGFWEDLEILVRLFGVPGALELCRAAERSVEEIGAWCTEHDVDAWYTPSGHLGVASSPSQEGAWHEWYAQMVRLDVHEGRVEELTADQVAERCRSPVFGGGVFSARGATLQPARLARGLRRELLRRGVRVFEGTPVLPGVMGIESFAEAAALGTIAVLLAGIPAAILLGAMGATYAPVGLAETGLGLLLAIPYVVGFVGGASGRLRVPSLSRERVR